MGKLHVLPADLFDEVRQKVFITRKEGLALQHLVLKPERRTIQNVYVNRHTHSESQRRADLHLVVERFDNGRIEVDRDVNVAIAYAIDERAVQVGEGDLRPRL